MNKSKLSKIFKKHGAILAYQFGSSVNGVQTEMSDLDIAVLYEKEPTNMSETLGLINDLSEFFDSEKVDLANLNRAPALLKHQAATQGKLLFEAKKDLDKDFAIKALQEYEDMKYIDDVYYESLKKRIGYV